MIGEKTLKRNAISLFSSSGIGDLGLKANDITTIIGCDILPERMNLFQHNYPEAKCFCGNIWDEKKKIIDYQTNKEETTGLEICGQLSCDNCQLTKCPQDPIAF